MTQQEYIKEAEEVLLHTYNRYPIVFEKADGIYLYDMTGKKYLDFASGIGVFALGYGNQKYNDALKEQIDRILHTSNLYYNVPAIDAAKKLVRASGMDKVFFTNSGTEAIEGAIKTARKYAYRKDGRTDHEIIAMEHSFHGRSMGALSVTGNAHYREAFRPMIGHVEFAKFNDLESVKSLVNEKTCAVIMETVQGEGGIYPADKGFIEGVREICDQKDILLILDEVQCGMGRCGEMFAWQMYGVKPDIMASAKALGCGVPVGAFLMTSKVAAGSLVPGDHGTTYGGNPFACAAVSKVFDLFEEEDLIGHVKEVAPYFMEKLDGLVEKYDCIKERRGVGFMQGLQFDCDPGKVVLKAQDAGLLVITAGNHTLRFLPPLVAGKKEIDEMIEKLEKVLNI